MIQLSSRAFAATLLLAGVAASANAQSIRVDYEQVELPNGLTVILHRDATTPTIATNVWYHVGSGGEAPGRTGFAHLFEHIMFEGSQNVPEGKIDEWFEEVGGSPNGSTSRDRTNYMQSFASNALDMALFIESDRMGHLIDAMSPASVDGQRDVVKNERRQSVDNRPYGLASQLITEALYPASHPYSWPVIGYMDHLSNASYDDVVNFFRRYYAPNNASIAIAGDIDIVEATRLARHWFADLPAGESVPAPVAEPPVIDSIRRIMLEDRVQLPRLYMVWVSPPAYRDGDAAMSALAQLLAGGKNSRLYNRLVYELQIADDVSAYQNGGRLGGEFGIVATARSGHTLEELERVILEEVDRISREVPEPRELERIVNQYEVSFLESLELVSAKANQLNEYFYYTGTPDYFNQDLARFRDLGPGDLSAAVRQYLDPDHRVILSVVPLGRTELAIPGSRPVVNEGLEQSPEFRLAGGRNVAAQRPGPVAPEARASDAATPVDRSQRPAIGEAPALTLPAIQSFALSNGMRVLLMEKHDLPLVQLNFLIGAGTTRDDATRPGIASMTAAMLDEGAAGKTALEIADGFEMLGARFGVGAGTHTASVSLRAPSQQFVPALDLAADVMRRPDFPDQELDRLRTERLTGLIRRHDEPNAIASVLFSRTLFGAEHPYGRSAGGTEASLRAMSTADLRAFHEQYYQPGNISAVIVGDIDRAAAMTLLEERFGSWTSTQVPADDVAAAAQVTGRTIYIVDKPGAAQSIVQFGRIGVPRSSADYFALEVMNVILGGSFTSRLNQNLREDKGYSYGARSGFEYLPAAGPWFAGAAVQTPSTGPAITEFMNELSGMHQPIPAEEVDRAKNFLAMRYPAGFQSVAGVAGRLGDLVQYGLPADYFNRYVDNVLSVTKDDVERVARHYIDPENVAIIVVGDRSVIEQQIRDLELGEIRLLEVTDVLGPVPVLDD